MPSPKSNRIKGVVLEKNKGRLSDKASSFHGRGEKVFNEMLPRPRTLPDLMAGGIAAADVVPQLKFTKLLLNVTIQRSPGAVQVVISPEATVEDLIAAALRQYEKEARRPVLPWTNASGFDLHYSQFSLQSLDRAEKLMRLGSRNFFVCPKAAATSTSTGSTSSCSNEAAADDKATEKPENHEDNLMKKLTSSLDESEQRKLKK